MSRAQDSILRKPVNLDFIQGRRDEKRVALAIDHLSDDPEGFVSRRELAQAFSLPSKSPDERI